MICGRRRFFCCSVGGRTSFPFSPRLPPLRCSTDADWGPYRYRPGNSDNAGVVDALYDVIDDATVRNTRTAVGVASCSQTTFDL